MALLGCPLPVSVDTEKETALAKVPCGTIEGLSRAIMDVIHRLLELCCSKNEGSQKDTSSSGVVGWGREWTERGLSTLDLVILVVTIFKQ